MEDEEEFNGWGVLSLRFAVVVRALLPSSRKKLNKVVDCCLRFLDIVGALTTNIMAYDFFPYSKSLPYAKNCEQRLL